VRRASAWDISGLGIGRLPLGDVATFGADGDFDGNDGLHGEPGAECVVVTHLPAGTKRSTFGGRLCPEGGRIVTGDDWGLSWGIDFILVW
jgi:hypothetical protein